MGDDKKRALVLELFAQDVQDGLDVAVTEKGQALVQFIEGLSDKYRVTLQTIRRGRRELDARLDQLLTELNYS